MINLVLFIWGIANYLFSGFVFMKVWNWFPAESLNIPTLTLVQSLGLLVVLIFFKKIDIKSKKEQEMFKRDDEEKLSNAFTSTLSIALILMIGCIVSLFI